MNDEKLLAEAEELAKGSPYKFGCNIATYLYLLAQEGAGEILEYMEDGLGITVTRFEMVEEETGYFGVSPDAWSTCYLVEDDRGFVTAQTFWEGQEDDE